MYKLELRDFILSHDNWEELLTGDPYYLKISRDNGYILFKYNQVFSDFNIPLVREARGIIFRESDWECVCHPFDKFGNYGESYCPEINWKTASVQEKVDGSLIKFWHDNGWHISTNGTIDAFKANLNDVKYQNFGQLVIDAIRKVFSYEHEFFNMLDPKCTYMFELVSPYNRVVIPYEETKIYFLGIRDMEDGEEWNPEESDVSMFFSIPKRYSLHSLEDVKKAAEKLQGDEGFVVCDNYFNRVKIKTPWYVLKHRLINNHTNSLSRIIDIVRMNEQNEFLIYCPEYTAICSKINDFLKYISIESEKVFENIYTNWISDGILDKKHFALLVENTKPIYRPFCFCKYNNASLTWDEYINSWSTDKIAKYYIQNEEIMCGEEN